MEKLTNREFKQFLKYYDKFNKKVGEISKNESGESLIEYEFNMYSLDEMCWDCELLEKYTPKTVDALCYKESLDNKITLYLVEFKFHNFNDPNAKDMLAIMADDVNNSNYDEKFNCLTPKFKKNMKKINKYYGDEVEFSLILKPIESLNVVIPALYDQYCIDKNIEDKKDIRKFLNNIDKKFILFVSHYDEKSNHGETKQQCETMDVGLRDNYKRLEMGNIIDYHEIYPSFKFDYFVRSERLI